MPGMQAAKDKPSMVEHPIAFILTGAAHLYRTGSPTLRLKISTVATGYVVTSRRSPASGISATPQRAHDLRG